MGRGPRRPSRPGRRQATSVGLAILIVAIGAPAAQAGTAGTGPGDAVGYTAGPSEANRVTVTSAGDSLNFTEVGAGMAASGACTMVDAQTASCPATPQTRLTVRGGDLDDQITNASGIGAELLGGDGHDVLNGSVAADRLDGEAGPDDLDGGPGDDVLGAGPGPPAADADTVVGGPGTDSVSYATRSTGVDVSGDGVANDGAPGEADNVALDVENVTGSSAADRLVGGPGPNLLDGAAGADTLSGGAGADLLVGGPDRDAVTYPPEFDPTVSLEAGTGATGAPGDTDRIVEVEDVAGDAGRDTFTGDAGANRLTGAAGEDYVDGRGGVDQIAGGSSADVVVSRDGTSDQPVSCGSGTDLAIVDRRDQVVRSGPSRCERVDDGTRTTPRRGSVYLDPLRCAGSTDTLEIKLPAMRRRVPLRYSILVPAGFRGRSAPTLDASDCPVRVKATPGAGRIASADVSGAAATVAQTSTRRVTTTLTVARPRCGGAGRGALAPPPEFRLRVKTNRRPGRWRVKGKHSIAAAVGTDWTTVEGCARTVTIVRRGRVRVLDRSSGRSVVVRAGQRYVARRR